MYMQTNIIHISSRLIAYFGVTGSRAGLAQSLTLYHIVLFISQINRTCEMHRMYLVAASLDTTCGLSKI